MAILVWLEDKINEKMAILVWLEYNDHFLSVESSGVAMTAGAVDRGVVGKGVVHVAAHSGELGVGDHTGVVSVAGGNSVGEGQTSSNLSDGVGIRVSLPLADGVVVGESVVGVVGAVAVSVTVEHVVVESVHRVGGMGKETGVVSMAGGNSVGIGQTSSNLADGVGIGLSLPLADGVVIGESVVGAVDIAGRVGDVADVSGVVGPTGEVGISPGNAGSHLTDGVSIGVRVS